jgi:hypothetical protein
MTVTPAQFAALHAALTGDEETFERLAATADFLNDEGFPILVATAFVAAAQQRFPPGWSRGDVVRFVADLRAHDGGANEDLSATTAEQMLISVLTGEPMAGESDENAKGIAQVALLAELVSDLNEHDLSTFLAQAREQADAWLAQHVNC